MKSTSELIPDLEVSRVHGSSNFGSMTPRQVVDEGVLKYAFGYSTGHTQMTILLHHRLIRKPRPMTYDTSLTKKGKAYLRSLVSFESIVSAVRHPRAKDSDPDS